jgi:UDP-4-amino-4,6-dideoxy-N-acetyl-beta-L-altrosamine transaminase
MTHCLSPLPYGRQTIEDDDIAAVTAALQSGWLTSGPTTERFETAFAEAVGARHAIACSSGTAALHLTAAALRLEPGDAVIVPAVTFVATANAVRYVGAEVVFADVDPATGLMRPSDAEKALRIARARGLEPRALFPVHLAGQACEMPAMRALADRERLVVVEDACHAIGTAYEAASGDWARVGSCRHSTFTVFSMHPVKTITMGEGGVVTSNDPRLATTLRRLRNHGVERDHARFANAALAGDDEGGMNPWYHEFPELGFNYRASEINCALGLSQLGKLERFVGARRALVSRYEQELERLAPIVRPIARVPGCRTAWHLMAVHIDFASAGIGRAQLMRALSAEGIATQVHYIPVPWQPYYRERYGSAALPGAAAWYARCLSLPLFPTMSDADVVRVVSALKDALEGRTSR